MLVIYDIIFYCILVNTLSLCSSPSHHQWSPRGTVSSQWRSTALFLTSTEISLSSEPVNVQPRSLKSEEPSIYDRRDPATAWHRDLNQTWSTTTSEGAWICVTDNKSDLSPFSLIMWTWSEKMTTSIYWPHQTCSGLFFSKADVHSSGPPQVFPPPQTACSRSLCTRSLSPPTDRTDVQIPTVRHLLGEEGHIFVPWTQTLIGFFNKLRIQTPKFVIWN